MPIVNVRNRLLLLAGYNYVSVQQAREYSANAALIGDKVRGLIDGLQTWLATQRYIASNTAT